MDKVIQALGLIATLMPEAALVKELYDVVHSGDPAAMDAMLTRLQAENDELGAA